MKNRFEPIIKLIRTLEKGLSVFEKSTLFLSVMIALAGLFANVVLRYGFSYTLAWSEEIVRLVIIYTTFIGASVAVKESSMIRIDAVVQFFPKTYKLFELISLTATIFLGCLLVRFGWQLMMMMKMTNQHTIILNIPMSFIYGVLPLSGLLMGLRGAGRIFRLFI